MGPKKTQKRGFFYSQNDISLKKELVSNEKEIIKLEKTKVINREIIISKENKEEENKKKIIFKGIRVGADTDIEKLFQIKEQKVEENRVISKKALEKNEHKIKIVHNLKKEEKTIKNKVFYSEEKDSIFSHERKEVSLLKKKKILEKNIFSSEEIKIQKPEFESINKEWALKKGENSLKSRSSKPSLGLRETGYFFGGIPVPPPKELKKVSLFSQVIQSKELKKEDKTTLPWKAPSISLPKPEKRSLFSLFKKTEKEHKKELATFPIKKITPELSLKEKKKESIFLGFFNARKYFLNKSSIQSFYKNKNKRIKKRENFSFLSIKPFALSSAVVFIFVFSGIFLFRGLALEQYVLGVSTEGLDDAMFAVEKMKELDFLSSENYFNDAGKQFENLSTQFNDWAGILGGSYLSIPFISKISSGKSALEIAMNLSYAGKSMSASARLLLETGDAITSKNPEDTTFIVFLEEFSKNIAEARLYLVEAQKQTENIQIDHLPEEKRELFLLLKSSLPEIISLTDHYVENMEAFSDMVGANGPRKYLFLFQNTHEVRATGGFIGSYGFLDVEKGHIRKFFVDDVFNPDGQLRVDTIPPEPIRKISAGWSLHDSNWFPHFPLSAEKAMYFYEKGGGPTVDGVIAITPKVLERLLQISGPIDIPEYEVTIDAENFMDLIQYEVEEGYDPKENRPKKILGELSSLLIEKLFLNVREEGVSAILSLMIHSLSEKHILLYSRNEKIQTLYESSGWSGDILETDYDYLNIIHSNINGFKTDKVIEEDVRHESKIMEDGSIQNTVSIHRKHNGGDTEYQWYNGVNADYLRVYVPKGSQLISVTGHTREAIRNPLDYKTLGFTSDETVSHIESTMIRDDSGTQIFEESGKTVFGNWVYVSPKEEVTVTYTYILPFRVQEKSSQKIKSFSLLAQKQSGNMGRKYSYTLQYPEKWDILYRNKNIEESKEGELIGKTFDWDTDMFFGAVFE